MENLKEIGNITYKSFFNIKEKDKSFTEKALHNAVGIVYKNGCIIKEFNNSYLYIVDDILIANRCGFSLDLLKKFIETKCTPLDYELKHQISKMLK